MNLDSIINWIYQWMIQALFFFNGNKNVICETSATARALKSKGNL